MKLVLLAALTVGVLGCPWQQQTTITIGALLPLTGYATEIGVQELHGIDLALTDLNAAKCWPARRVQYTLMHEDTQSDEAQAVSDYQALLGDAPDMLACLSSLSRISTLVVPEADAQGVPVLAVATSMPGITEDRPWAFRLHSTSALEAQAMAHFWLDGSAVRNVAFFYVNDAMGEGARATFAETFTGDGASVVWEGAYEDTDTDFAALIAAALAAEPDGVYVMGFMETTVQLMIQLRAALGEAAMPIGSNLGMATPEFIASAGEAYEGVHFTSLPFTFEKDEEGTRAYAFAERFREAYSLEPDIYGALAYDTMGMIVQAAGDGGMTRETFRDNLAAITDYPGVMGALSFDANRELVLPVGVAVVQDGVLQPVS